MAGFPEQVTQVQFTMLQLEQLVTTWAHERSIFVESSPAKQAFKTQEELWELYEAILLNRPYDLRDAIGDILVTLIIQAAMRGFTLRECLQSAWNDIKDRKGQVVDGLFMKEEQK